MRKRFRKITVVLFVVVIALTFVVEMVGCGNSSDNKQNLNQSSDSRITSDSTGEKNIEKNLKQNEEESDFSLSDGPIFVNYEKYSSGNVKNITLTMYSLKDGKQHKIFSYSGDDKYLISWPYKKNYKNYLEYKLYYYQVFDSKLEKMAVSWLDNKDNSTHVGWIDKSGKITDVSNTVHPATSDFSSVSPHDGWAHFTSNDKFIFYDSSKEQYCYFDPDTNNIIEMYDFASPYYVGFNLYGIDCQDRPTEKPYVNFGGTYYLVGDITQDWVKYDDGYVLFHLTGGIKKIKATGVGVTDLEEPEDYQKIDSPYYSTDGEAITPESEYNIESMSYCNNEIVFTATKGTERGLFRMSYVDREAGEPEKIKNIDSTWGDLIMWKK